MFNHIDLPTEIERFGQVFFCQSQFVIGAICCAEKPVSTNIISLEYGYLFLLASSASSRARWAHSIADFRYSIFD